jgi:hypothetical protein
VTPIAIAATLRLFVVTGLILALVSCKSSPTEPEQPPVNKFYDVTTVSIDIFDDSQAGGAIILNGERKDSGGTFRVENGRIDSIFVEVPGFNPDYIFCQNETGETLLTRDASGLNCPALTTDITLYLKLIPSDFNVTMLAKCLGGTRNDGDPNIPGDGTVQRFGTTIIFVYIGEPGSNEPSPTNATIQNLTNAVMTINTASQDLIQLVYLDEKKKSEGLNGIKYRYENRILPSHLSYIEDNVIIRSVFSMRYDESAKTVLESVVRSLGIRRNGGGLNYPYISANPTHPTFINDGERALQLIYLLPPGFKLKLD